MTVAELRPSYETEQSREVEAQMALLLSRAWNCQMRKLPRAYNFDYAATRNDAVVAWIELKRRYRNLTDHDRVFLSLQKVIMAMHLRHLSALPCLFVGQFNDGFFYADIVAEGRPIEFRGRTDRNDSQDQEAVIAIPVGDFVMIKVASSG